MLFENTDPKCVLWHMLFHLICHSLQSFNFLEGDIMEVSDDSLTGVITRDTTH